jgi:hypothetical protein
MFWEIGNVQTRGFSDEMRSGLVQAGVAMGWCFVGVRALKTSGRQGRPARLQDARESK